MSKFLYCNLVTGPHSKFFKPAAAQPSPDVVQDIGENNEVNGSSTESAQTSSTIMSLFMNGKVPTTLNQDESVETTFTTDSLGASSGLESIATPLTTSVEESTPTGAPASGSSSNSSSSEVKASTGDKVIEEATTMMVGGEGEADVTRSVIKEDQDQKVEGKTRIKSGGAVVEYKVNERDLNREQGGFTNI